MAATFIKHRIKYLGQAWHWVCIDCDTDFTAIYVRPATDTSLLLIAQHHKHTASSLCLSCKSTL